MRYITTCPLVSKSVIWRTHFCILEAKNKDYDSWLCWAALSWCRNQRSNFLVVGKASIVCYFINIGLDLFWNSFLRVNLFSLLNIHSLPDPKRFYLLYWISETISNMCYHRLYLTDKLDLGCLIKTSFPTSERSPHLHRISETIKDLPSSIASFSETCRIL